MVFSMKYHRGFSSDGSVNYSDDSAIFPSLNKMVPYSKPSYRKVERTRVELARRNRNVDVYPNLSKKAITIGNISPIQKKTVGNHEEAIRCDG